MKSNLEKLKEHGDAPDVAQLLTKSFTNFPFETSKWKLIADFPICQMETDPKLATELAKRHYNFAAAFYAHALHEIANSYFGEGVEKAVHAAPNFADVVGQISYSLTTGETPLSREYQLHHSIPTAEKPLGDHVCNVQLVVHAKKTENQVVFVFCVALSKATPDYASDKLRNRFTSIVYIVEGDNLYANLQIVKKELLIPESVIRIGKDQA